MPRPGSPDTTPPAADTRARSVPGPLPARPVPEASRHRGQLHQSLDRGADLVVRVDDERRIVEAWVQRATDLGADAHELLGCDVVEVFERLQPDIAALLAQTITTGLPGMFTFTSAEGSRCLSGQIAIDPSGVVIVARDVTVEYLLKQQLEYRSLHDGLTELANRAKFHDEIERALEQHPIAGAIVLLDLDDFKLVNDVAGHHAGDAVLTQVAQRLRGNTRRNDVVARLDGDEFAVLLRGIKSVEDALAAAHHLHQVLRAPFPIGDRLLVQGCSVGVTQLLPGDAVHDILRRADVALYAAKTQGKDTVASFDSALFHSMKQRHSLVQDLERAIHHGEVRVAYQPICDLVGGRVLAVEALARWSDRDGQEVAPDVFVRAAEEHGLIAPLFEAMLTASLDRAAQWCAWSPDLRLNVNVSAVQVRQAGLAAVIDAALSRAGVTARNLTVEITESVLALDMTAARTNLEELRELGVGICLDDFGTGYSSLSYLQRFGPTSLKLDRTFVEQMTATGDTRLAAGILGLANHLEIDAVAEGIETEPQWRALRDMGWRTGQGFLMSRPVPASQVPVLLDRVLLPAG